MQCDPLPIIKREIVMLLSMYSIKDIVIFKTFEGDIVSCKKLKCVFYKCTHQLMEINVYNGRIN